LISNGEIGKNLEGLFYIIFEVKKQGGGEYDVVGKKLG
jgi:hypothetical protein